MEAVLEAIQLQRQTPPKRSSKHLCTDSGHRGAPAMKTILDHGYIPCRQEAGDLKRHPAKRARRWIVEVADRGFNPIRKLLVRCEKLEHSFVALNHLAAPIIAFR
jgi:hypothetical protein